MLPLSTRARDMIRINVRHDVSPVRVEIAIDVDVHNYDDIARKQGGTLAGLFSSLGVVRSKVDEAIHARVEEAVATGLAERLRPELLERIKESVAASIRESLATQLAENGVEADTNVEVTAR